MAATADAATTETRAFQAETKQLLDLFIRSVYSSKEVFLRELVSNASDAIDRLRFESLTEPRLASSGEPEIRLAVDRAARTLTIADNGIGMSRDEVIDHIGTIARSGTRELVARLKQSASSDQSLALIGQFGVGFYSAFMVADRVVLVTRRAGGEAATRWESAGDGTYTIGPGERASAGTAITLHLKPADPDDGLPDFTDEHTLAEVVRRYSDFVRYPIRAKVEREEPERDEAGEVKPDAPRRTVIEDRTLNSMKAIWRRRPQEVTAAEYEEFYRQIAHDWEKPLRTIPFSAEGRLEYRALLFVPSRPPFDVDQTAAGGLQLYTQNVKILERCEALLPRWLRFVRGVVDSADLSLNVSRELLQQDRQIAQIQKGLVKKLLDLFAELAEKEPDVYRQLWDAFGRMLKEGAANDWDNREKLLPLLRFDSSADAAKATTLQEYVGRMKQGQEAIYFLSGESRALVEASPHLELFKKKGVEVLLLTEPVDELFTHSVHEFAGKKLASAASAKLDLLPDGGDAAEEQARKETEASFAELLAAMRGRLGEQVKEVRLSRRLTDSAACLVGDGPVSPRLERLMGQKRGSLQRRILEVNPDHEVMKRLQGRFARDKADPIVGDYAELLLGQALLAEGSELGSPARFGQLVSVLMVQAASA
jgi:molecular chaperone HtpG